MGGVVVALGLLPGRPAAAVGVYDCPRFLLASGYADLCGPGAWLPFMRDNTDHDHIHKRHDHDTSDHPPKVKYRPHKSKS